MGKRRANGEGSVYRRRDGRWCAQLVAGGRRLYHYGADQAEVKRWLLVERQRCAAGVDVTDRSTLGQYLEHWLSVASPALRPSTETLYRQVVRDHVAPIGGVRLAALRPDHLQGLYGDLQRAGASPWTVRKVHIVLHRALEQAARWGLVVRNVADLVERPRVPRTEMRTLTADQVAALLASVAGTRWEVLYRLAVVAGLRQGELLALRWSDVDWGAGTIAVQRQVRAVPGGGFAFSEPKSAASRRSVVLDPDTVDLLWRQRDQVARLQALAGDHWQEWGLVFPSEVGTPILATNLHRRFVASLAAAGLPRVRFHDLRHTSATLLFGENVHPKVVQERLGHSSVTLTLQTYSHRVPAMHTDAALRIGRRLSGDSNLTADTGDIGDVGDGLAVGRG